MGSKLMELQDADIRESGRAHPMGQSSLPGPQAVGRNKTMCRCEEGKPSYLEGEPSDPNSRLSPAEYESEYSV